MRGKPTMTRVVVGMTLGAVVLVVGLAMLGASEEASRGADDFSTPYGAAERMEVLESSANNSAIAFGLIGGGIAVLLAGFVALAKLSGDEAAEGEARAA